MKYRTCGHVEIEISVLGLGCWAFGGGEYWGKQDQQDVDVVVRRAVELGINYFDTAESYNEGRSETALGKAMRGLPHEKLIVGTKISPSHCDPEGVRVHCEASLRRLGAEYIDLYMVHWPIHPHSIRHFTNDEAIIRNPPRVDDAFAALESLQQQGKIRYIGVSNFAKSRLEEVLSLGYCVAVNELPYSLLTRAVETEILPFCRAKGIGVIGYMTLLQGILADIYPTLDDVPVWQRRTWHFSGKSCELIRHGEEGAEEDTNQALHEIRVIMKECGLTMPEIAIQWAIANEDITCALVGARTVRELEANVKAVETPLSSGVVERLNAATQPLLEKLGSGFDYYESKENDRTR